MTHAVGEDGHASARAHLLGYRPDRSATCSAPLVCRLKLAYPAVRGMLQFCAEATESEFLTATTRLHAAEFSMVLLLSPSELMGAHVGDACSHTNGRAAIIALQTLGTLSGHAGIGANLLSMPVDDLQFLRMALRVHKEHRTRIHREFVAKVD